MSEIIKQSMANIWASIGDVVEPEVEKIAEGWSVEVVPRQYWNWMQNRTDTNLAYLFQHGIPEWDATVEYIVNKSYVTYADVVYKAILTGTNKIPSSQPTYWKVAFATSTAALEALKATTPAADKLPYFNSATTAATTTITPLARTLLDDTTQGEMLTTVGAQPVDATLTALAGVTTATNKLPYFSGVDTATVTDLTAFGRSLIDDADAATARTTLGLGSAATATVTTSATDTTAGRVLKVGDFGVGKLLDLRSTIYSNGIPSDMFGVGTLFGFADGNTLGITGFAANSYGILTVNSQWQDASGGFGTSRSFLFGQRMFLQGAASASAWQPWVEVATSANSLGQVQTWQDVTGSRVLGTTYTNSTGRPIVVSVTNISAVSGSVYLRMCINGMQVSIDATPPYVDFVSYISASMIVPNGATYFADNAGSAGTLGVWSELR